MEGDVPPPPPPPPHGQSPRPPGSGLPNGNYDIFIIPPHASGSGFLYLPSMQPHRNSFLLGVFCTVAVFVLWKLIESSLRQVMGSMSGGGGGGAMLILMAGVGVAAWAFGKTQGENDRGPGSGGAGGAAGAGTYHNSSGPSASGHGWAPPPGTGPQPAGGAGAHGGPGASQSSWDKARAETKKKEEERRKADDLRRKREEAERSARAKTDEAERTAKARAEKDKWEQMRAREKEQREKDARERIAKEKLDKEREAREKDQREREARQKAERDKETRERAVRDRLEKIKAEREAAKAAAGGQPSPSKSEPGVKGRYEKPSARSAATSVFDENMHSYRPYDTKPKPPRHNYKSSASSISGLSEGSYAPSMSTTRTTPPPSQRGPYSTREPGKVQIKGVYLFTDSFPNRAIAQLESNKGHVTDGLILRIETEGLFIDDDVRGVPQREWDVKAWTLKLVEEGKTPAGGGLHVLRASIRDPEGKKYVFVLNEAEAWKVAVGLQKLRKGSQVRSLHMSSIKDRELNALLSGLGWL